LVGNDTVLWSREYCDPLTDNYPVEAAGDLVDVLRALRHDLRRSEYTWENPSLDRYIEALCRHLETHAEGAQWAEWANLATSFKAARRNNGLTSTSALRAGIPTGDQLSASWRTDHDGTGVLTLECSSQGFAGTADAWFGRQHLLSFAASLSQFPVPTEGISLSGGMGAEDSYREQIGIVVAPLGNRGQIDVRLHLANEVWPGNPPEGSYETTLHLLTTYRRLAEFASEFIRSIEFGATDAAVLKGERLD
ncbi:MAG: hypothetical protein GY708_21640, partial [Actinomycetia bacterium]|nr:hypothetical protein [Actinomycetes bacterium]